MTRSVRFLQGSFYKYPVTFYSYLGMTLRDLIVSFLLSGMSFLYSIGRPNSGKITDARILGHMPIFPAGKGLFRIGNDICYA